MNPNSSSAAVLGVAVLLGVCALAYFVFPGQDAIMIAIGVVGGFVLAMLTFAKTVPAGATIPVVLGAFVGLLLVAFAIPWVISRELRATELGSMRDGLLTMSGAVGALLWGVALRLLWNSRKLIQ
jgi:hypothetical protein